MFKNLINQHTLWAFIIVLTIPLYSLIGGNVYNDVESFYQNVFNEVLTGTVYGVNTEWVYPIVALIPMLVAGGLGLLVGDYLAGWIIMVMVAVFTVLLLVGRKYGFTVKHYVVILVFSVAMSGVFYYRLDIVAVLLTVVAVMVSDKRKQLAYFLLVLGVFVKVWPIAVIVALWVMSSRKLYDMLSVAGYVMVVLLPSLVFGGWSVPLSFVFTQEGRGVQVESLFAVPLFLQGSEGYYDADIVSYNVSGVGVGLLSVLSTLLLVLLLVMVVMVAFGKYWSVSASRAEAYALANIVLIGFVLFNKVGSTHFVLWLFLSLLFTVFYVKPVETYQHVGSVLVAAVAAGLLYPYFISYLMVGEVFAISLLVLKQFMVIVLFGLNVRDYVLNSNHAADNINVK